MAFNSLTFVAFIVIVLAVYHLPLNWTWKKTHLLIASYVFYAAWNPPFVILIWLSTVVDWYAASRLGVSTSRSRRRLFLGISLAVNLGLLGFFKYAGFLARTAASLLAPLGIEYVPPTMSIVLPVGISFYTFQTLSYTIDVYRGRAKPWHSFLDFALYVTFFPQLVAGPIVRSGTFLPQCQSPRKATGSQFVWGAHLLVLGLFMKVVLADGLFAPVVETVYGAAGRPDTLGAWCGTLAFAGQIFCDFAGYSTCAIGVALLLGFSLPRNFLFPYAALGFSDFWRRWHISLSSWLRDYLYIPLGGNRGGGLRTHRNLMLTMLLGGLWHGASWTFVVWGGLHGLFLSVERLIVGRTNRDAGPGTCLRPVLMLATFAAVCFTWVFFRANTFDQAFGLAGAMVGLTSEGASRLCGGRDIFVGFGVVSGLVAVQWLMRDTVLEEVATRVRWWYRSAVLAFMLVCLFTMGGDDRAFIYFQF